MPVSKVLVFGVIFFAASLRTYGQECNAILSELVYCMDSSDPLTIDCPANHWILIKSAIYRNAAACPAAADDSSSCVVNGDVTSVQDTCHQQQSCSVSIVSQTSASCTGDVDYIDVIYQCEPLFNMNGAARAMSLSNVDAAWSGTEANINNHPHNLLGVYTYETAYSCSFTVSPYTEFTMSMLIYTKKGTYDSECDQKIQVSDAETTYDFCSGDVEYVFNCTQESTTYNLEYVTSDTDVGSIFVLRLVTAYSSDGLTLKCGYNQSSLPDLTVTSDVTVSSEASTGEEGMDWRLVLLIAMVSISFFIMLVVIFIVCTRLRSDWAGSVEAGVAPSPASSHSGERGRNGFAFITEVYIDGDQKSKLVVDKKNNRLGF